MSTQFTQPKNLDQINNKNIYLIMKKTLSHISKINKLSNIKITQDDTIQV